MKVGLYNDFQPCLLTDRGVVDISSAVQELVSDSPQITMERIISNFATVESRLRELESEGTAVPLDQVRLRPPLPRPGKVICGRGNFMEGVPVEPVRPL